MTKLHCVLGCYQFITYDYFLAAFALGARIISAIDGERIVGMSMLLPKVGYAYIQDVAVLSMYRRQGIGRHMVETSIDAAENLDDIKYIELQCAKGNDQARRIYESLGFVFHPRCGYGDFDPRNDIYRKTLLQAAV